jgi:hypothetical protein
VNLCRFLAELKRRNVYRAAVAYGMVAWLLTLNGGSNPKSYFKALIFLAQNDAANAQKYFEDDATGV